MKLTDILARYRERLARAPTPSAESETAGALPKAPVIRPEAGPAGTPGATDAARVIRPPTSNPFPGVHVS